MSRLEKTKSGISVFSLPTLKISRTTKLFYPERRVLHSLCLILHLHVNWVKQEHVMTGLMVNS